MEKQSAHYIHFLQQIGETEPEDMLNLVNQYVSPDVKKVINNQTVCNNSLELSQQLQEVRTMAGRVSAHLVNHCNDTENRQCAVRYLLSTETAGSFTTLAIVDYDENQKIRKIDEIYTTLDNSETA